MLLECLVFFCLTQVVQKVDNAINWLSHYPVNSLLGCFVTTYPLDSDLFGTLS